MKKIVAAGFLLVVGAELLALAGTDRRLILIMSGVAVACALFGVRWYLVQESRLPAEEQRADDAAESLRRWLSRTETLISQADATRRDWDRHLRPTLARQFEMATGQIRPPRALMGRILGPIIKPMALKDDEPLAGYRRVYVEDPFGNRIELMEPCELMEAR